MYGFGEEVYLDSVLEYVFGTLDYVWTRFQYAMFRFFRRVIPEDLLAAVLGGGEEEAGSVLPGMVSARARRADYSARNLAVARAAPL